MKFRARSAHFLLMRVTVNATMHALMHAQPGRSPFRLRKARPRGEGARSVRSSALPALSPAMCLALSLVLLMFTGGCAMEHRVISSGWDQFPQDPKPENGANAGGINAEAWTVVLHQFTGPRRQEEASRLMRRLEREARLDELWIGEVGGTSTVYRGRYGDQQAARRALRRTQRVRLDGERRLENAVIAPLGRADAASDDPLDLSRHSGQFSLQIGYFDDEHRGDRRAAAEDAVNALRAAGHEAYFYHGPYRSLVTLGAYHYEVAFVAREDPRAPGATVDAYADHIRELQRQFPYNLGNPSNLIEQQQREYESEEVQPSALVRVY